MTQINGTWEAGNYPYSTQFRRPGHRLRKYCMRMYAGLMVAQLLLKSEGKPLPKRASRLMQWIAKRYYGKTF